jgi:hypothetical protein
MTSKIKVDNINKVSDDSTIIKKCGTTTTVGSGSGQTIVVDGATVTLGRCGGAVNLAPGATQTGFGRTGTVNWCTTAKTSPLTAVSGNGYFINTTGGVITVTLPSSPSAGDIISISDYASTFATNNLTLCRNSSLINGGANNGVISTNGLAFTLVYVDGTRGWKQVNDATENISGVPTFICASGGTVTTSGDFKIHTFNSTSSFVINTAPTPANNNVSYMVVAGGGGSGCNIGGGGGAGGFREGKTPATPYTASPLVAPAGLPVAASTTYPVTVGGGGAGGSSSAGASGGASTFSTITSAGGGGGGKYPCTSGLNGGSGGGAGRGGSAGSGNIPPTSPVQGNAGGPSPSGVGFPQLGAGGGGGATAGGGGGSAPAGGTGGAGATTEITASPVAYAGGGGGGTYTGSSGGAGGTGGGASGGPAGPTRNGTDNTGGGAAGNTGTGGSGIVVIRYKFQ